MKKVLVLDGSTRKLGNTSYLIKHFIEGAEKYTTEIKQVVAKDIEIKYCNGCLRCNLIKRCSIRGDDWEDLSAKINEADVLVFASPIYFHYLTAPLKNIIDRFRSFVHVQITESGLIHTPWNIWNKDFVLLLSMGSSDDSDAQPVIDLFEYMKEVLGDNNRLHVIKGTRLAVIKHVQKTEEELKELYPKLMLDERLAENDFAKNLQLLNSCKELGEKLTKS
ncbi:MAG: hypothetical protein C0597_14215 [Marinilabiliales bacterium]|nr:MAG: hypothetical protein C0597_14215 [Marinilabiliales bacterium]